MIQALCINFCYQVSDYYLSRTQTLTIILRSFYFDITYNRYVRPQRTHNYFGHVSIKGRPRQYPRPLLKLYYANISRNEHIRFHVTNIDTYTGYNLLIYLDKYLDEVFRSLSFRIIRKVI